MLSAKAETNLQWVLRLEREKAQLILELQRIVAFWTQIEKDRVPSRKLSGWEKERLSAARKLLLEIGGQTHGS